MTKKLLLLLAIFSFAFSSKSQAQCAVTKSVNGSSVSFNMMWPLAGIYILDSVRVNWGDATTTLYVFPSSSLASHTYTSPGSYQFCLTRYLSALGNPGVAIPCTYCDSVTIAGAPAACNATANFSQTTIGTTSTFLNTSTCTNCTSTTYSWNFGDGSPASNQTNPLHTYTTGGTFNVCLTVTGVNSAGAICSDTFCNNVTITAPVSCTSTANFNFTNVGYNFSFLDASTCTNCANKTLAWSFGDGGTSIQQNPVHLYTSSGSYNVCLIQIGTTTTGSTCIDTTCKTVNVALGINNITTQKLEVFPNPTKEIINITMPYGTNAGVIKITDLTGRTIISQNVTNVSKQFNLPVTSIQKGMYYIELQTEKGRYMTSIIKE